MLAEVLKNKHLILASSSPRRQELIKGLGLEVEIRIKQVKEEYPDQLRHFEISDYSSIVVKSKQDLDLINFIHNSNI